MRRLAFLILIIFITGVMKVHAQKDSKNLQNKKLDSLDISGDLSQPAQMLIYNPKDQDAKILQWQPSIGWFYNMPIVGKRDSTKLNFGENLLEQGPADIDKKKKNDSTQQE